MNRVRIVAVAAVAMGAAVVAGTKFQQSREAAMMQAAPQGAELATASVLPSTGAAAPSLVASSTPSAPATAPSLIGAVRRTESAPTQLASADPAPVQAPAAVAPSPVQRASVVPNAQDVATPVPAPGVLPRSLPPIATAPLPLDTPLTADLEVDTPLTSDLRAELEACAVWLVVTPAPGAMLETSVYAPCDANAQVHLDHAGLAFDARLGADGQLLAQIPALTDDAQVTIRFADGREQSDHTTVPDLAAMQRVALMWQAPAQLELNAYEFGASYGEAGHVSSQQPKAPGIPGAGFLTMLGDDGIQDGQRAQVYSYPAGESPQTGNIALEIEVPVTDASCGHPVSASTIELNGSGAAQIRTLRLDMPGCDGAAGYVVLPGVLPQLQIALN